MKYTKKLLSLVLVLVLALALAVPGFAAKITIDPNLPAGGSDQKETYTAYKIFDASFDGNDTSGNVSYTIDSSSAFFTTIQNFEASEGVKAFTLTQLNSSTTYVVSKAADYNAAKLAEALKGDLPVDGGIIGSYNEAGKYVIDVTEKGYYFITSSLGSKIIVDTLGDIEVDTKNQYPTLEKKIMDGINPVDSLTADYGETINFQLSVAIPATASGEITVHDTLDADMTYVSMTAVEGITANTSTEDGHTVDFVLSSDYVAGNLGKTINIAYTATLNANVATATAHPNEAYLTYAGYTSVKDTVNVYTYKFDVFKYTKTAEDVESGLAGAGFVLKNSENKYYKNTAGIVSWVDNMNEATEYITATDSYTITFAGLANGTYTLIEKTVPTGYNPAANVTVTINNADLTGGTQIKVLNQTGTELPGTGGMGTTIFYTLGGVLVVGAAILLVTKKRVHDVEG